MIKILIETLKGKQAPLGMHNNYVNMNKIFLGHRLKTLSQVIQELSSFTGIYISSNWIYNSAKSVCHQRFIIHLYYNLY